MIRSSKTDESGLTFCDVRPLHLVVGWVKWIPTLIKTIIFFPWIIERIYTIFQKGSPVVTLYDKAICYHACVSQRRYLVTGWVSLDFLMS